MSGLDTVLNQDSHGFNDCVSGAYTHTVQALTDSKFCATDVCMPHSVRQMYTKCDLGLVVSGNEEL